MVGGLPGADKAAVLTQAHVDRTRHLTVSIETIPVLGAEWERRSAASCGHTRSDAVIVAAAIAFDVRQRRQTAGLLA
jgi:hypothetical protein